MFGKKQKEAEQFDLEGTAYYKARRYSEAIRCFDQSIQLNPNDKLVTGYVWNRKGRALFQMKKYVEALECFEKALKLNPYCFKAWKNKEMTLQKLRTPD